MQLNMTKIILVHQKKIRNNNKNVTNYQNSSTFTQKSLIPKTKKKNIFCPRFFLVGKKKKPSKKTLSSTAIEHPEAFATPPDACSSCFEKGEPRKKKKNSYFPLYWLVNSDPYNGLSNIIILIKLGSIIPYIPLNNQDFFIAQADFWEKVTPPAFIGKAGDHPSNGNPLVNQLQILQKNHGYFGYPLKVPGTATPIVFHCFFFCMFFVIPFLW